MIKKIVEPEVVETVENVEVEIDHEETRHAICKIAFIHKGYIYFTFEGDTLRELVPLLPKNRVTIDVEYIGIYGQPDFKVIRIK